jgi:hypothetical protein
MRQIQKTTDGHCFALSVKMRCRSTTVLRAFGLALSGCMMLTPQPPPPPADARGIERRIREIQTRMAETPPHGPTQKQLAVFVERYLDDSVRALKADHRFQAQRFADAADACRRPIEHLQQIGKARTAPGLHPKPPGDPADHLREVYFRLRLAEVFLRQISSPAPDALLVLARSFYQQALKAQQQNQEEIEGEYTRAADDLTHALESLAQAALP